MEEKIGLIKDIECRFVKTDPETIDAIALKRTIDADIVRRMMRYNMFTIRQFAKLTGVTVSHILNKTSVSVINGIIGTELDYCYPFRDTDMEGPKFIVRNEKAENHLKA
jgi:hypothetical protein